MHFAEPSESICTCVKLPLIQNRAGFLVVNDMPMAKGTKVPR